MAESTLQINVKQYKANQQAIDGFFESFTAARIDEELTDTLLKVLASSQSENWDEITKSNKIFLVRGVIDLIHSLADNRNPSNSTGEGL